jgi:hypothetical protein
MPTTHAASFGLSGSGNSLGSARCSRFSDQCGAHFPDMLAKG